MYPILTLIELGEHINIMNRNLNIISRPHNFIASEYK